MIFTTDLAYVLNFLSFVDFGPEISPDGSIKHLHHECKQGPRESSVPSTFRRFISDERMLRLHFQKLHLW